MDYGLVLFTSDRGIKPAAAAKLAEDYGFHTFYVPEHTHIPVKRAAAHPTTGDASLPDDRYMRTLDPWVSLGAASAVTSRIRLATAVALPVEHDPITLAKSIASLDYLSGGRVTVGVGFGWNTDELSDHGVPPGRRRTMLREYLEAMRALWTQEEAAYDGEFVSFGPSWAWPKPVQPHIPVLVGAAGNEKNFAWIARSADGWITTPREQEIDEPVPYRPLDDARHDSMEQLQRRTPETPLHYPGVNVPAQEEKLVLPGNPLEQPTAVPGARNRGRIRDRISTSFRRNRVGPAASQVPGRMRRGEVWEGQEVPRYAADPMAQTIIQESTPPLPQQSVYSPPPAYPGASARHSSPGQAQGTVPPGYPQPRPAAHRRRRRTSPALISGIVGMVVLVLLIAGILAALATASHSATPRNPNVTATATAQASPSATASPVNVSATQQAQARATAGVALTATSGTPIFADPLSSNINNWSDDGTKCAFISGTYHVVVQQSNFLQLCESNAFTMDNDAISADVYLLSGDDAGMIFRVNGTQFYDFEITSTGNFFFRRHDAGTGANYQYLISNTKSSAIAPGNAKNTLLAIANGGNFKLYINGIFVGEAQDNTYSSGQIGFVAGTLPSSSNAEGSFANLKVYKVS